jgi:hypothetical protein
MKADQSNFAQAIDLASIEIGESGLSLLRYGSLDARLTGALRTDGILRGLGGLYAGAFTTTARDAIAVGGAPTGLIVLNTTTARYEWNQGTDVARNWLPVNGLVANAITNVMIAAGVITGDRLSGFPNDVTKVYLGDGTWGVYSSGEPDEPTKLYQNTLPNVAAAIYTVAAAKQVSYKSLFVYNSDSAEHTVTLFDGGGAAGNTIVPARKIPAGDSIEIPLQGMVQATGGTIYAVTDAGAGLVSATLYGSVENVTTRVYKRLFQYSVTGAWAIAKTFTTRTRITRIHAANTNAAVRGLGLAHNGSAVANILQSELGTRSQIPGLGVMLWDKDESYLAFANTDTLQAKATVGADVILTAWGIEE